MARSKHRPEAWRVKQNLGLIRQVRGKPLLEALFRLQDGFCAYDEDACALLLPQTLQLASHLGMGKTETARFATIDHVVPRALGGANQFSNLVMASQVSNCNKGSYAPYGPWIPKVRHKTREVEEMLKLVEQRRAAEAYYLAEHRKLTKTRILEKLIERELARLDSRDNFKFYREGMTMVA